MKVSKLRAMTTVASIWIIGVRIESNIITWFFVELSSDPNSIRLRFGDAVSKVRNLISKADGVGIK